MPSTPSVDDDSVDAHEEYTTGNGHDGPQEPPTVRSDRTPSPLQGTSTERTDSDGHDGAHGDARTVDRHQERRCVDRHAHAADEHVSPVGTDCCADLREWRAGNGNRQPEHSRADGDAFGTDPEGCGSVGPECLCRARGAEQHRRHDDGADRSGGPWHGVCLAQPGRSTRKIQRAPGPDSATQPSSHRVQHPMEW